MLPDKCDNCQTNLLKDVDFYIDRVVICDHKHETSCSYKYECKNCKYESGWNRSKTPCNVCESDNMNLLLSNNRFKNGDFKEILYVDKGCMESMPCQHYLFYIDNLGEKRSILLNSNEIYALFFDCGLPIPVIH